MDYVEVFLEFLEVFDEGCYCFVEVCGGAGVGGRGLGDDCVHWEGVVDVVILGEGEVGKVLRVEGALFLIHGKLCRVRPNFADQKSKGGFWVRWSVGRHTIQRGQRSADLQPILRTSCICPRNRECLLQDKPRPDIAAVRFSLLSVKEDVISRPTHQSPSTKTTSFTKSRSRVPIQKEDPQSQLVRHRKRRQ